MNKKNFQKKMTTSFDVKPTESRNEGISLFIFLFNSKISRYFFVVILLIIINIVLYKIYSKKILAFGCFDDCFNFVAGYFMLSGKSLYSQIYFNHQPFMAYISYLIQIFTHPINIYELVLRHRQFVFAFNFLLSILLVWRFKKIGILFVLLYEFSKFYVFGDRFLAEGVIIYPLVYMTGLVLSKLQNTKLTNSDYILGAIFCWFIIFMREPVILFALTSYFLILIDKSFSKIKIISISTFLILIILTFNIFSFSDYFNNVIILNFNGVFRNEVGSNGFFGPGLLKVFFYPIYIFIDGKWNIFRQFLIGIDLVFITSLFYYFKAFKKNVLLVIFFLLGLLNFRVTLPGTIFYEAFHMLPWFGVFVFVTLFLYQEVYSKFKKVGLFLSVLLIASLLYIVFSPDSFIREKTDQQVELLTNYGNYLQIGEVVKSLSNSNDTLFLDGADDLIYWQANRKSAYKYSFYYRSTAKKYDLAREEMFLKTPPDFYYDFCTKAALYSSSLPMEVKNDYLRLNSNSNPACLYVRKNKISKITDTQWKKANEFLFSLPPDK